MEKVRSDGAAAAPAPPRGRGASRTEAEKNRDLFRAAVQGEENNGTERRDAAGEKSGKPLEEACGETLDEKLQAELLLEGAEAPLFSGDALLRALGGSFSPVDAAGAETVADGAPQPQVLAKELAERILVSAAPSDGRSEVRISLKDSVLPDTEITIRWEGDSLIVRLSSGDPSSLRALRATQDDLLERLAVLGRDARVELLDSGASGGDDSDRRSRGLEYVNEEGLYGPAPKERRG
jgi:type III secretion system needle length determinant